MAYKFNISTKDGKTYKLEGEAESLEGKEIGMKLSGNEIHSDLAGYELEITGGTDNAGLALLSTVEGLSKKRVLLTYGTGMHKRSRKEGKKKRSNFTPKGLRLRKTVRGKVISPETAQVNLKVVKEGGKKLHEIWPDQNQPKEKKK